MINILPTPLSPKVILDGNKLLISGKLLMESPPDFFEKISKKLKSISAKNFLVEINVNQVNSSSIKQLLIMFKILKELEEFEQIKKMTINWNIEDYDIDLKELINDLASISELKINVNVINMT